MRTQGVIDLERKDRVPSALDHLLLSADNKEIAVVIDVTDIARSQPSLPEGAIRLQTQILADDANTTEEDLTIDARRCLTLRIIEDEKLGVDWHANRAQLALPRRKQI